MTDPDFNPYASPQTTGLKPPKIESDADAIRQHCISHETSIRAMALLYFIGATLFIFPAIMIPMAAAGIGATEILFDAFLCILGVILFFIAFGLRRLNPIARIAAT